MRVCSAFWTINRGAKCRPFLAQVLTSCLPPVKPAWWPWLWGACSQKGAVWPVLSALQQAPFWLSEPTVCLFKDPESPTGNRSTGVRFPSFLIRLAHLCAQRGPTEKGGDRSAVSLPSLLFLVSVVVPQHFCLCVLVTLKIQKEQLGRAGGGYRPRL